MNNIIGSPGQPLVQGIEDWPFLEENLRSLILGHQGANGPPHQILGHQGASGPPHQILSGEGTNGPPPLKPFHPKAQGSSGPNPVPYRQGIVQDKKIGKQPKVPLSGPQLRQALLEECEKENFALLQVGSENFNEKLTCYRRPEFVSKYLKRHDVRPLKKKSEKFPKALYYCRLCDYHCDKLSICIQHIEDVRHSRLTKMQEVEITLFHLPKPTKHHLETLEQVLYLIEENYALRKEDLDERANIANSMGRLMSQVIPGSSVRLYGSSLSGFGLRDSDVNLDLQIPESLRQDQALLMASNAIEHCQEFGNVQQDFCSKTPIISFYVRNLRCELSLNNHNAFQTSALLRDYYHYDPRVRTLSSALRSWARLCKIDRQAEGTLPAHAFPVLLVYFLQQGKKPVLPCIHDHLPSRDPDSYESTPEFLSTFKTRNNSTVSELWIEFFEYYSLGFNNNEEVVSIRNIGGFTRDEKQWKGKKLAIEDPFSTKRSLTRSVNHSHNLDFIGDCFKIAYLYFGTVQTTCGPTVTKIVVPDSPAEEDEVEQPKPRPVPSVLTTLQHLTSGNAIPPRVLTLEELERSCSLENEIGDFEEDEPSITSFNAFRQKFGTELTPKQAQQVAEIVPKNMILFRFDADILTGGQRAILMCNVCGQEGHLQSTCPEENLPPMKPLPPMQPDQKHLLNVICQEVMNDFEPNKQELQAREYILQELTRFIRKTYPTAILTLYGSSRNGFAIRNSDLDISLTFSDQQSVETVKAIEIIDNLAEKLTKMFGIGNIQPITSAKVPILKFVHLRTKIEGDISLYNILAQENTEMLLTYSKIDPRVKVLGYMVKCFAKTCDIGDASKGSLSSYAYILMLIYYLQQCEPPVLPVLQEFHPSQEKPSFEVDGWNAWFFKDLNIIKQVWSGYGKNQKCIAELWIEFLEFYGGIFNDKNLIVSIKQHRPLTKFEKMWNSPCIAIEDPFELEHNLGAGLSRKMNLFIKKAFIKSRDHFGSRLNPRMNHLEVKTFLFNPDALSDGLPPNDRGCRACGKIGHLVRDCPRKKNSDERKKREKRDRDNNRSRTQSERESDRKRTPKKPENRTPAKSSSTEQSPTPTGSASPSVAPTPAKIEQRPERTEQIQDNEPFIDPHFKALLEQLGTGTPGPGPSSQVFLQALDNPRPIVALNQAINVEDLERSFNVSSPQTRGNADKDQKPVAPPPGFPTVPTPIGMRHATPPIGQSGQSAFQPVPQGLSSLSRPPYNPLQGSLGHHHPLLQGHPIQNPIHQVGFLNQRLSSSPQPGLHNPQAGNPFAQVPPQLMPGQNLRSPFSPFDANRPPAVPQFYNPMMQSFNPFGGNLQPGQSPIPMMGNLFGPPQPQPPLQMQQAPLGSLNMPTAFKAPNSVFPDWSGNSFGLSFGPTDTLSQRWSDFNEFPPRHSPL